MQCDYEYRLATVTDGLVTQDDSAVHRTCAGVSRHDGEHESRYDGEEWHCVRRYCPAELIELFHDTKACAGCNATRTSSQLLIPRTDLLMPSSTIRIRCPESGFVVGSINRTCQRDGWDPLRGVCTRKRCPAATIKLAGWNEYDFSSNQRQHEVMVGSTPTGTWVNATCKAPFQGVMSLYCPEDGGEEWDMGKYTAFSPVIKRDERDVSDRLMVLAELWQRAS